MVPRSIPVAASPKEIRAGGTSVYYAHAPDGDPAPVSRCEGLQIKLQVCVNTVFTAWR